MNDRTLTILHVEDDTLLAHLVKTAFTHFGFQGDMIAAGSVSEAVNLLNERAKNRMPLSLIISDMQLPDGTGLDVIREVKANPTWRLTPVIVLSHDVSEGVINDAYALGANSYMPKVPASGNLLDSLQIFYQYWLEHARLPRGGPGDRIQEALERAIGLRTRTANFYLGLARASEGEPDEVAFWLDRALNEGNLSNLIAFFRNELSEKDLDPAIIDRFASMQGKVNKALTSAEERLKRTSSVDPAMAYRWSLELTDALDEDVFAEACGYLFPKSPVATAALKARASVQLKELSTHILERTDEEELRRKAGSLLDWSKRLGCDQ